MSTCSAFYMHDYFLLPLFFRAEVAKAIFTCGHLEMVDITLTPVLLMVMSTVSIPLPLVLLTRMLNKPVTESSVLERWPSHLAITQTLLPLLVMIGWPTTKW